MRELQNTLLEWYRQFTPNVYVFGDEYDIDPASEQISIKPMPLIAFGYGTSDFAQDATMTFDIWTDEDTWAQALSIEDAMAKALPSQSGAILDVKSGEESLGVIWLQRGNPFTQSVPIKEHGIKRRTGNIIIRSFMM